MKKRLVLLCDGTWNDDGGDGPLTNIVRLRDILARSLGARSSLDKHVSGVTDQHGVEHIVFYDRGVGTGPWLDRIKGGVFGLGLGHNVRQAYRFLARWYSPGDEIYVFGFSRGAFTARSVVGYLGAVGLLRKEHCTPTRESQAWEYYRTPPNDRLSGLWSKLTPFVHEREGVRVTCLGVFDTVGALGIPSQRFRRLNRSKYEFHDVTLGSVSDVNLHAIAVDEQRRPFEAAVWRKPQFKCYGTKIEQVWFPGVHSDVGGGYVDHFGSKEPTYALDDISLDWMMKRVNAYCPTGLWFDLDRHWKKVREDWSRSPRHESRSGIFRLWGSPASRSILNIPPQAPGVTPVSHDRLLDSIGEMIHISVLERMVPHDPKLDLGRGTQNRYAPANVLEVLPLIEKTYGKRAHLERYNAASVVKSDAALVVDWNGDPIDPISNEAGRTRVSGLIDAIRSSHGGSDLAAPEIDRQ